MPTDFPLAPESHIGNPAPFWFLLLFKVLGFTLHSVPMHIWFGGMLAVAGFSLFGGMHARRLAQRLVNAMPFVVALGINFGIVPLLFIQVAYYPVLYPANILMGWFWLGVIPLLLLAYYGVYYYAVQVRRNRVNGRGILCGIVSCGAFLAIGFIFTNNFALMVNRAEMLAIYDRTAIGGAVTGLALNLHDPQVIPRWLMALGLAMTTTAVFVYADGALLARSESAEYRAWTSRFAFLLHTVAMVWFAGMGAWYLFGTVPHAALAAAADTVLTHAIFGLTAVAPGAVWLALLAGRRSARPAPIAWIAAALQLGVISLNAVSRQLLQNAEVRAFFDPAAMRVNPQYGPMAVFLVLFVIGVAVIAWMLRQLAIALKARPA